jgi:hypothetical protein
MFAVKKYAKMAAVASRGPGLAERGVSCDVTLAEGPDLEQVYMRIKIPICLSIEMSRGSPTSNNELVLLLPDAEILDLPQC